MRLVISSLTVAPVTSPIVYMILFALYNIIRFKERYIITSFFLVFLFACTFCLLFYNACIPAYIADIENECRTHVKPQFRSDLQERDIVGGIIDSTVGNFNDDGSMDRYNYPVYYEIEIFEEIAALPAVTESYINYAVHVYTENIKPLIIYGGDFKSLTRHASRAHLIEGYDIIEGRMNESGECLVHVQLAEEDGISVGDELVYYNENGEMYGSLYVSGIFMPRYTDKGGEDQCGLYVGSNPFYAQGLKMWRLLITDFDTAYSVTGDLHEFNNYCIWYTINTDADTFCTEAETYLKDETHEFDWDKNTYVVKTSGPNATMRTSWKFIGILLTLTAVITAAITIYNYTERHHDFGILYALGADNRSLTFMFMLENAVFMTIIQFIAIFTSRLLLYVLIITDNINDYTGLEYRFNDLYFAYVLFFWGVTVLFTSAISALLMHRKRTIRR